MNSEKPSVNAEDLFASFIKSLTDITEMTRILGTDCQEHYLAIRDNDNQSQRRAYVRAVFAFIEGVLYCTKAASQHIGFILGTVNLQELIILDGMSLDVNNKGDVATRPFYPQFLNNFKFTFKIFAKSVRSTFSLDLSHSGWQSLGVAVKIRDRLMHPKEVAQLDVTDKEVEETKKAFDWFMINQALSGNYAQRAVSAKASVAPEALADLEAQITFYETELSKRWR